MLAESTRRSKRTAASRSSGRPSTGRRSSRSSIGRGRIWSSSTSGCRRWTGSTCLDEVVRRFPEIKVVMLSASTSPELIAAALRRGASAYLAKSVDPTDLPSTLRQVLEGNVWRAEQRHRRGRRVGREGVWPDRPRDGHPAGARAGVVERRDREGAVGDAADGEVPPHEHLPQARRQEPDPGDADRPAARARRQPAVRRRGIGSGRRAGRGRCARRSDPGCG